MEETGLGDRGDGNSSTAATVQQSEAEGDQELLLPATAVQQPTADGHLEISDTTTAPSQVWRSHVTKKGSGQAGLVVVDLGTSHKFDLLHVRIVLSFGGRGLSDFYLPNRG